MRAAARDAEMHWIAWSERALIDDPEIRAEYDAALDRKAAAAERAIEARQRVRKLHEARDELARREARRVVIAEPEPPKKAPAPRERPLVWTIPAFRAKAMRLRLAPSWVWT